MTSAIEIYIPCSGSQRSVSESMLLFACNVKQCPRHADRDTDKVRGGLGARGTKISPTKMLISPLERCHSASAQDTFSRTATRSNTD
ncbi:hypothetical protein GDO86_019860 [Hymenochirus boettgeri]|uniref:Uncharacterized protein n=1 Tax=Hymenochirus boettgeri TaxID=247094 RepID=A0A8T2IMS2_9PIPI|nr:hypothetical protein GDO86_019860 [Hymenochirus boettgeri]